MTTVVSYGYRGLVTIKHAYNFMCFSAAVRLGRCPKKDRPAKTSFLYMPGHSSLELDRQLRTEQLVLTVHAAYQKACEDFDHIAALFSDKRVRARTCGCIGTFPYL
ncbi:hypothetical protein DPMN_082680 [Dreissena polymorpha]|uniref:Uncharacterized protein n=1 Tax=Dreissena polymorpha TaxID=45954 RepID=A0A9D3Y7E6_DREPO|nr:hypothetical protein DPMN_082680 [Dreissena polymorpha]